MQLFFVDGTRFVTWNTGFPVKFVLASLERYRATYLFHEQGYRAWIYQRGNKSSTDHTFHYQNAMTSWVDCLLALIFKHESVDLADLSLSIRASWNAFIHPWELCIWQEAQRKRSASVNWLVHLPQPSKSCDEYFFFHNFNLENQGNE